MVRREGGREEGRERRGANFAFKVSTKGMWTMDRRQGGREETKPNYANTSLIYFL